MAGIHILNTDFGIQLNTEILKFHLFINNLYQLSMYQSIYIKLYQGYYVTKINLLQNCPKDVY